MIWILPSVVRMWYTLGSLFIPPLLIPILSALIDKKRLSGEKAILLMLISFLFTFVWFIYGTFSDGYPLEIEPFIPGLIISILIYFIGGKSTTQNEVH